jgi:hypothetical protein
MIAMMTVVIADAMTSIAKNMQPEAGAIEGLKSLPWVQKVEHEARKSTWDRSIHHYYHLTTKPNVLMRIIRHKAVIQKTDGRMYGNDGIKLKQSFMIPLPAFRITISTPTVYGLAISLVKKPKPVLGHTQVFPNDFRSPLIEDWDQRRSICLGTFRQDYQNAESVREKAELVAMFLQTALKEQGSSQSPSAFAYFHGLMPSEYVKHVKDNQ